MNILAQIVTRHPYMVLVAVAVISGICLVLPFALRDVPNFTDPQLGFETRGSCIAQRLTAWQNLLEETKASGKLAVNPKELYLPPISPILNQVRKKKNKRKKVKKNQGEALVFGRPQNYSEKINTSWESLREFTRKKNPFKNDHIDHQHTSKDGFFCGTPNEQYARAVLTPDDDSSNLFTYDSLSAMCHIERQLTQNSYFKELCETISEDECCRPWSLVNYIALLNNRTSCLAITEHDIDFTSQLLRTCALYYHNLQLSHDCSDDERCQVPLDCARYDAVFNILHYLTDTGFSSRKEETMPNLKSAMIFLPIARSTKTLDYYGELEMRSLTRNHVQVAAMDLGLKEKLFDLYLLRDIWLISLGGFCIVLCIWAYTNSWIVTFAAVTSVIFSLGISYFIYTIILRLTFFPFMNLLATVVAVGIGADDFFVYCKAWNRSKQVTTLEENSDLQPLSELVTGTFRQACPSILVTSLTTAAALYSSLVSSITAVKCFSVFAATTVVINFTLMITWLPACFVVSELCCTPCSYFSSKTVLRSPRLMERILMMLERRLVKVVVKFRRVWLISFNIATIISLVIVLKYPGLQLPDSSEFQLFSRSHLFERYNLKYKHQFYFERIQGSDSTENRRLPLRFVWGVLPVDNGDYMDPHSRGTLQFDPDFDMSDPASQEWLLKFCRRLRSQPFYMPMLGPLLPNCFIESFYSWMQRRCFDPIDHIDRSPCCETETFPYKRDVFESCIVQAMSALYDTPSKYLMPGVAGPKFSGMPPKIKAVVVEYDSNQSYTLSFPEMDAFFKQVEGWTQEQLKDAPASMKNGWFISDLDFYDLQRALSYGTVLAVCVAMATAFIVLFMVTLNVLLSLYAVLAITCSIFSVMAILVLLGWRLNVLESVAVSTAVGLAVDFALHYGVAYRFYTSLDAKNDRVAATKLSLTAMSGPTSMAAITTSAAGAFMMPSSVLPYIQIGMFLVIIMSISWLYATFFFGGLLASFGPEHGYGQFSYPSCWGKRTQSEEQSKTSKSSRSCTNMLLSETTLSTTSHDIDASTSIFRDDSNPVQSTSKYFTSDQSPSAVSDITVVEEDN